MENIKDQIFIIFGASGDLTKRKLIPAIFNLYVLKQLPKKFVIIGTARTVMTDKEFRDKMIQGIKDYGKFNDEDELIKFSKLLFYKATDTKPESKLLELTEKIKSVQEKMGRINNMIFYLSTPPMLYSIIPKLLASQGYNNESDGWKKVIIEKPFGYDLESAEALNKGLMEDWKEEQIYRIDHYLGKETVQNILVTRFSNGIFEPLWNRNYVHHIEITSAEDIGVEDRGGYYDSSGALRDMIQNHFLQLLGLITMEPPASLKANSIRGEINKVLQAIRPIKEDEVSKFAIRGQYLSSEIRGKKAKGYREEEGVPKDSKTETFAAIKFYIDNWRWGGVPFYIRSGKRMPTRVAEAVIHFKPTPHHLFTNQNVSDSYNQLIIRIQPDEGILIKFGMKTPGSGFNVQNVNMDFHYSDLSNQEVQPAYQRLIHDSMLGDKTLFAQASEVMAAWKFLTPILNSWKNNDSIPVYGYPAGTWGPEQADDLIEDENLTWRYPCKNLADDGIYCEL
ncbi:MAG: glucose-6-phosphate dehydrogenase [Melioribacteraceae bacterium]